MPNISWRLCVRSRSRSTSSALGGLGFGRCRIELSNLFTLQNPSIDVRRRNHPRFEVSVKRYVTKIYDCVTKGHEQDRQPISSMG